MKWLIYLLILLNIAMFVWHFRSDDVVEHTSLGDVKQDEATLSLVLLKEQQQQKEKPMFLQNLRRQNFLKLTRLEGHTL